MELGEGVPLKAGLYLGLADRDAAGLRMGWEEACWRVHTSPPASCSTSWALARADLGQTRRSASESHDTPCALRHAGTPLHDLVSGSASRRSTAILMGQRTAQGGGVRTDGIQTLGLTS